MNLSRKVPADVAAPLLLLSRPNLGEKDVSYAAKLCEQISDWPLFVSLATRKFSLPLVHRNLIQVFPSSAPENVDLELSRLGAIGLQAISLKLFAELKRFHELCILPTRCDYAYFKGPMLGARYLGDPGLRFSRDIDVLVDRDSFGAVLGMALIAGYGVKPSQLEAPSKLDEHSLRAIVQYEPVITLVSPLGVQIEVHTSIDYDLGLFDSKELLANATTVEIDNNDFRVLKTSQHFCYVCFHSIRHTWSRLNWLSDIGAMLSHSSFDLDETLDFAGRSGLLPAVEATLKFFELSARADRFDPTRVPRSHAEELLSLCMENLKGDLEFERALTSKNAVTLPFYWPLKKSVVFYAIVHRFLKRLSPSFYQYQMLPLHPGMQWLYYPSKPIFALFVGKYRERMSKKNLCLDHLE